MYEVVVILNGGNDVVLNDVVYPCRNHVAYKGNDEELAWVAYEIENDRACLCGDGENVIMTKDGKIIRE